VERSEGQFDAELARIRSEYHLRASGKVPQGRYGLFNEAALLHAQSVERALLSLLKRHGLTRLTDKTILDVGCGGGSNLRRFIEYGARAEHLTGLDLLPERIESARRANPAICWTVGSAHAMPFDDATFDLVTSSTLFSSILGDALREQIAREMWRVRKPGGVIVCHDFIFDNPRNRAVRGVSRAELRRLFALASPKIRLAWRRVTLAPPISRVLAPRVPWLVQTLEHLKLLNTHMVALISEAS
jgi:ubiquinone/menaquinone biosynthesis C-methylase UbiE